MAFSDTSYLSCQPEQPPLQKESQFRLLLDNRNDAIFQLEVVFIIHRLHNANPLAASAEKQHQVLPSRAVQKP